MLVHIVVWKYKEETPEHVRREHIERLSALSGVIPQIVRLYVGSDILGITRSYDTGLVAEFADLEALEAYTVHEAHKSVASMGKQIADHVASVDFIR